MWRMLSGIWKARRARKAAVAIIAPFVERSRRRLSGIPEAAWLDPYLVGFMVMLITLIAWRRVNALDNQMLGLVQCGAWGDITGLKADLVGEETLHFCAIGDCEFERGCFDAASIDVALQRSAVAFHDDVDICLQEGEVCAAACDTGTADVIQLWDHYFETHVINAFARQNAEEREPSFARIQS